MDTKVCIIGAGPAGLMAAIHSARLGAETIIVEGNTVAGRKLLMTGGGRCNLTHTGQINDFVQAFGRGGRFLRHCFYELSPQSVRKFFADRGLGMRVEKDGCVFPVTDRSGDVREVLLAEAEKLKVGFKYGGRIEDIEKRGEDFVVRSNREVILARRVIIATGGVSWPDTGSVGDGYRFAQKLGHTIVELRASLVPLVTAEKWVGDLAGVAVENVRISTKVGGKKVTVAGSMLFTCDGIGGPVVLDLSGVIADYLPADKEPIKILIDLFDRIAEAVLEKRILEQIDGHPKKTIVNVLAEFVPRRVAAVLCEKFGFGSELCGNQLRKDRRKKLVRLLKALPLSITAARPIAEAAVTRGGVDIKQIEQKTMESKSCPGLFFAGEVMNVDGPCGGYNLQMCWSSGALAGKSAAR